MKRLKNRVQETLKIEMRQLDQVVPYKSNPRKIPSQAVSAVANSIREHGFRQPIVVDREGVIIVGHCRLLAAKKLGMEKVPVHVADLSPEKARAYRLADNRSNQIASFDLELLSIEVKELALQGVELTPFGFHEAELKKLKGEGVDEGLVDNKIPDLPNGGKTRTGLNELWVLGGHRLFVGDASDGKAWAHLLGNLEIDMVFTDPPYGVAYTGKTPKKLQIQNDTEEELHESVIPALDLAIKHTKPGGCVYVACPAGPLHLVFANHLLKHGIYRQGLNWVKNTMVLGRSDYQYVHEPILYGWKPGKTHHAPPTRDQTSIFEIPRPAASPYHPTSKPVELMVRAIVNSSQPGWTVCDPFCGSGSTLIACEKTKRKFVGMEIDPRYADVVLARWEKYSGQRAEKLKTKTVR